MGQVVAVIGVLLTAYSVYQQDRARDKAEDAAEMNAQFKREETAEQARRLRKAHAQKESMAHASAYATGFFGESFEIYLEEMETAHREQVSWLERAGEMQAEILEMGGTVNSDMMFANMISTASQGLTSSYNTWMSAE